MSAAFSTYKLMAQHSQLFVLLLLLLQLESMSLRSKLLLPASITNVEGSPVDITCKLDSGETIEDCIFTVPGFSGKIKIFKNVMNKKYEFVSEGFSAGQCGLRLLSIERKNAGNVTCSLETITSTHVAQTELTVLYPVDKLKITSNNYFYKYKENKEMEFNCTAEGGFPAPLLSLRVGTLLVNSTSKQQELTWKGPAQIKNNGQRVECCADEQQNLLLPPISKCVIGRLFVQHSPRMENGLHEVEVPVVLGQDVNVTVNILANPNPTHFEMTKDGQKQADIQIKNKFDGKTVVYNLTISKVQLLDTEKDWRLFVSNDFGNTSVAIKLSPVVTNPVITAQTTTYDGYIILLCILVIINIIISIIILLNSFKCTCNRPNQRNTTGRAGNQNENRGEEFPLNG